jgi:hypothetical protein
VLSRGTQDGTVALSDRLTRTGPPACLEAPQQAFRCPVCHGFPTCLRAGLPVLVGGLDALRLNATAPSQSRGLLHRAKTSFGMLKRVRRSRRVRPVLPPPSAFTGFRFPWEVIVLEVRWYLRYGLSYRDVEELLAERGVRVDHVTIYHWVQRFTPLLIDAARPCRHVPGDRWFADETSWESQGVAAGILRVEPAGCGLSRWRGDR